MEKNLDSFSIQKMQEGFASSSKYRALQNGLTRTSVKQMAMNWHHYASLQHVFSHTVSPELPVTSQKKSGRCWLFAALNVLRIYFAKKYKLESFEFSQSYLFFWDKLEKANYFLENVLDTADKPDNSRLVMHLFDTASLFQDGGQWQMFVNLVKKYGLVPQSVYPDSEACLNSKEMNDIVMKKLRANGAYLRKSFAKKVPKKALEEEKFRMVNEIYRILSMHMGTPPLTFDWEFLDTSKKFHAFRSLTPKSFFETHVKTPLEDYVCLVHSPRSETPFQETYTVAYLGNVIEADPIIYLNVFIEQMKEAVIQSLKNNQPVWFGCDVGQSFHRDLGVMDAKLYDLDLVYDLSFETTKETRMIYKESQMTHAMLFTGVNLIDHVPNKWRVENSWGEKVGQKGYFIMTDDWFSEYVFEVAIEKKYLPKDLIKILQKPPKVLDPWDPLGALA